MVIITTSGIIIVIITTSGIIIGNCWVQCAGSNKIAHLRHKGRACEARVPKVCNFIAPQALNPAIVLSLLYFIA